MSTQIPLIQRETFVKPATWGDQSKGRDNPESQAAFVRLDEATDLYHVLTLITSAADRGITLHESADAMGKQPHEISGRFTRLKTLGKIKKVGRREWQGHTGAIYVKA